MEEENQFCTFYLDNHFFGVEVKKVQEVFRYQEMTEVPLSPKVVSGLINLRGQIITAIDLRRRLEMPDYPEGKLPMNVVVRTEEGVVSLLVDEIADVLEAPRESFEQTPDTIRGAVRELVTGVYKLEGKLLLVLDIQKTVNLSAESVA
ncbi:MAG: chemotaxis protein CheW [Nitrospinaceae bacterium]